MDNQQAYRQYCAAHRANISLFHQDWWLDAVSTSGHWQGLVSPSLYQDRAAILPIYTDRRLGIKRITRPPLTTYQGPYWVGYEHLGERQKMEITQTLWPELWEQLPSVLFLRQAFFPDIKGGDKMERFGFQVGVRILQFLPLYDDAQRNFVNFRKDTKRNIRRASERNELIADGNINDFLPLVHEVYRRQGKAPIVSNDIICNVYFAAQQHGQTKLWLTKDALGVTGGILTFFDHNSVYLLLSGLNERGRKTGAFQLLTWTAIQHFSASHQVFDFCGSLLSNIMQRNRSFGTQNRAVTEIQRINPILQLGLSWLGK